MNASRRSIIAVAAATLLCACIALTLSIATRNSPPPPCPACGSHAVTLVDRTSADTFYKCHACGKTYLGPARSDFSWVDALEEWFRD